MKILFICFMLVHGTIHFLGFFKAYHLAALDQLKRPVSKSAGILWLLTAFLFLLSIGFLLFEDQYWWVVAIPAVIFSQYLVVLSWTDAKFGTIANCIIAIPIIISMMNATPSSFQNRYKTEVQQRLKQTPVVTPVTPADIQHLPIIVQKYLEFSGAIGKPKVYNFRAVFQGSMQQSAEGRWLDITSRQYNFFGDRARLFYIQSSLYGIPFDGLHAYIGNQATMQIKIASLFQVADAKGEKMNQGETVTMFNDMCFLAPATLIDTTIHWQAIDSLQVKAQFTNQGNTITALLTFDENGQLLDFISGDRFRSPDGITYEQFPWSTPVKNYKQFEGRMVPTYAEAIWHTPQGESCYAKFSLQEIEYNCRDFK